MKKRIVLADDHPMFRQGLKALLEREGFNIVGEASNGHEVIQMVRQLNPLLVILDFGMPLLNGIDAAREIQKRSPDTQILLLTMFEDDAYVLEALRAGIRGYVLKAQAATDLINAIREVLRGSIYLSPGVSEVVVKAYVTKQYQPSELLTDRERQVLQLVAEGNTTKKIASLLGLSVKTAESHRTRIMSKLDIHDTAGLVRYAIRRGLIMP
ncbi:MAG: response regulator transcription factor [Pseudohongiellaceae bacterium]